MKYYMLTWKDTDYENLSGYKIIDEETYKNYLSYVEDFKLNDNKIKEILIDIGNDKNIYYYDAESLLDTIDIKEISKAQRDSLSELDVLRFGIQEVLDYVVYGEYKNDIGTEIVDKSFGELEENKVDIEKVIEIFRNVKEKGYIEEKNLDGVVNVFEGR